MDRCVQIDDVCGADRAKYALKYEQQVYRLHKEPFDFNKLPPDEKKKILQTEKTQRSGFVNRAMQTDMRESEAQTDPYTPPYKLVNPQSYPKVLALMKLTWGKGLPFTLEDIVVIERALSKRALENTERSADDTSSFEARIKLLEELEAQQWADREKELEQILQMKKDLTDRLIGEYHSKIITDHTTKLEKLQSILKENNARHLENVKHEYFRNLRKLERKYFDPKPSRKRDIIVDYTKFDSSVYAPLVRNGTNVLGLSKVPNFSFDLHRDLQALQKVTDSKGFIEKELTFDMEAFKKRIKECEPSVNDRRLDKKLEDIYMTFKDWHLPRKPHPFELLNEGSEEESTGKKQSVPMITLDGETEEGQRRPHVITLQKIARGRVIQKMIRKEIEDSMNELLGMKIIFDMDPNCLRVEEGQMQKLRHMREQKESDSKKDPEVSEVLGHLEGETLSKMLDFLDKEMIRLIDERKIHALILLAERERRHKEAAEAGRRFNEEHNRRENDEMFRQIVGIHQATVDIYLEEIFLAGCDRTADETARLHVRQMAKMLNEAAQTSPTEFSQFENEELTAEFVSNYLIPEIHRLSHQEKLDAVGKRYKKAASEVVEAMIAAQAMVKDVAEEELSPTVLEHSLRGWAAADGSANAMDDIFEEVVCHVLRTEDWACAKEAEAEAARLAKEKAELEKAEEEVIDSTESDENSPKSADTPPTTVDEPAEVVEEEEQEEEAQAVEEEMFEEPEVEICDDFREEVATKALQIAMETEPTEQAETLLYKIKEGVDEIILAAIQESAPTAETVGENEEEDKDDFD